MLQFWSIISPFYIIRNRPLNKSRLDRGGVPPPVGAGRAPSLACSSETRSFLSEQAFDIGLAKIERRACFRIEQTGGQIPLAGFQCLHFLLHRGEHHEFM